MVYYNDTDIIFFYSFFFWSIFSFIALRFARDEENIKWLFPQVYSMKKIYRKECCHFPTKEELKIPVFIE